MPVGRSARPLRAVVATMAMAMLVTLGVVPVPGSIGTAHALQSCPSPSGAVQVWQQQWSSRGVTLCRGLSGPVGSQTIAGYLQIVDLGDGADMRVISRVSAGSATGTADTRFDKKSAGEWDTWIKANDSVVPGSRLFSEINASFFVYTSGSQTPLSLPEMKATSIRSTGYAFGHHEDAAWGIAKKVLRLGDPNQVTQDIDISNFPTNYTVNDVLGGASKFAGYFDGLVGFAPLAGTSQAQQPSGRQMVGFNAPFPAGPNFPHQKVYMLTAKHMTLSEARNVVYNAGGTLDQIQIDGGCSTQIHVNLFVAETDFPVCRSVPEVLAVYLAP